MITKETIKSEIEKVPEERLDELFKVVQTFTHAPTGSNGRSLMTKLRSIQIDAPEDFAANVDQYLNGDKSFD